MTSLFLTLWCTLLFEEKARGDQTSNALVAAPYRKMSDKLTTQKEREKRPVKSVISSSQSCTFFPADFLSRSIKCNLCRQKASGYKERLHPVGKSVSATARRNDLFPLNASHARLPYRPREFKLDLLEVKETFPEEGERGKRVIGREFEGEFVKSLCYPLRFLCSLPRRRSTTTWTTA